MILGAAAALVASLALANPSQAGLTVVDTTVTFSVTGPNNPTITDFSITYAPATMPGMTMPTIVGTNDGGIGATVGAFSGGPPSSVTINFAAASATTKGIEWQFFTTASPGSVGWANTFVVSGQSSDISKVDAEVIVTAGVAGAPEPSTAAIFGIGVVGLFAVRRFCKRRSSA
jgi:hypothetical protein